MSLLVLSIVSLQINAESSNSEYPFFYNSTSKDNNNNLLQLLNDKYHFIDLATLSQKQITQLVEKTPCAATFGLDATLQVLKPRKKINLFAVDTPRSELNKLQRIYQDLEINITGIFQEQPFERQLLLTKSIYPEIDSVFVFLDQTDKYDLSQMTETAQNHQISLHFKILQPHESVINFLSEFDKKNEFLLISNNQHLYSPAEIANLVLAAAHQSIILIGNDFNSLKLGSFASVASSIKDLPLQIDNEIEKFCTLNKYSEPHFATHFNAIVNQQIVNKLHQYNDENADNKTTNQIQIQNLNNDFLTNNIISIEKNTKQRK